MMIRTLENVYSNKEVINILEELFPELSNKKRIVSSQTGVGR